MTTTTTTTTTTTVLAEQGRDKLIADTNRAAAQAGASGVGGMATTGAAQAAASIRKTAANLRLQSPTQNSSPVPSSPLPPVSDRERLSQWPPQVRSPNSGTGSLGFEMICGCRQELASATHWQVTGPFHLSGLARCLWLYLQFSLINTVLQEGSAGAHSSARAAALPTDSERGEWC